MPEPEPQYEPRTILQNLRLIATRRSITIYVINPLIFWPCFWFLILNGRDRWLPFLYQVYALIGALCVGSVLMCAEGDRIKARLDSEGYVQRRERRREGDYWLNAAVCGGFFVWIFGGKMGADIAQASERWLWVFVVGASVMITLSVEFFALGSMVWFTVRRRELTSRQT